MTFQADYTAVIIREAFGLVRLPLRRASPAIFHYTYVTPKPSCGKRRLEPFLMKIRFPVSILGLLVLAGCSKNDSSTTGEV